MAEPGYWMNEQSGVLRPAVERYLRHEPLSAPDIAALRAYLRQWIMSPVWDENPHHRELLDRGQPDDNVLAVARRRDRLDLQRLRNSIESLRSKDAIDLWSIEALKVGIDPW